MRELDLSSLTGAFGMGVAGNFAGHLEQAGEAGDFVNVAPVTPEAPKGVFPWFIPGAEGQLGVFPLSSDRLLLPASETPLNLQIEPEVGVLMRVVYGPGDMVMGLQPTALGAFNDCSIRRPGATKISQKKNWGPASKGLAARLFEVQDLQPDGGCEGLRLASFMRRDGAVHEYGIDSAVADYSYGGQILLGWIIDRLWHQTGSPDTPLEPVGRQLVQAGRPETVVVGIGATRYTAFGESTYLHPGDESVVVVYDARVTDPGGVLAAVTAGAEHGLEAASVLVQRVEAAEHTL